MLHNPAEDGKHFITSEFLQACMIDKGHCGYVFFDVDEVRFLRKPLDLVRVDQNLYR